MLSPSQIRLVYCGGRKTADSPKYRQLHEGPFCASPFADYSQVCHAKRDIVSSSVPNFTVTAVYYRNDVGLLCRWTIYPFIVVRKFRRIAHRGLRANMSSFSSLVVGRRYRDNSCF